MCVYPTICTANGNASRLSQVHDRNRLREAFQSKKQQNLGISPNRGGGESSKNQKSPRFQLGKVPDKVGSLGSQVPEGLKNNDSFSSYEYPNNIRFYQLFY